MKNIRFSYLKIFLVLVVKLSTYLNMRVLVMSPFRETPILEAILGKNFQDFPWV